MKKGKGKCKKRGGGVALILKSTFITKTQPIEPHQSFEVMEVTVTGKKDSVRFCVVYWAPSSDKNTFLLAFEEYVGSLVTSKGKIIVLGDFNFHVNIVNDVMEKGCVTCYSASTSISM